MFDSRYPLADIELPTWRNGIRGGLKILSLSVQVRWWVNFNHIIDTYIILLRRRQVVKTVGFKPALVVINRKNLRVES